MGGHAALPATLVAALARWLPSGGPAPGQPRVRVGVITGAGISADSGIPTYRGQGGLYDDPVLGDQTVEALSLPTLLSEPDRTWSVVATLARQSVAAEPNDAHRALAALEEHLDAERAPGAMPEERPFLLLTQNVDGLHQRAGSREVLPIHGDVLDARCLRCTARVRLDRPTLAGLVGAPSCTACGGVLRPDAVLFGEMLPEAGLERLHRFFLLRAPTLLIAVGTSALFPYIAEPVRFAARSGESLCIEVNPEPSALSPHVDVRLPLRAAEGVPPLVEAVCAACSA